MKFHSVLAASVALACLSTVALASGVQFRGTGTIGDVAQDAERITLQFAPRTNVLLGGTVVSDVVRYDGPNQTATVSGGQVRVCPTSACGSDGGWVSSTQVKAGQFVQLRRAGPQAVGATVTAALEIAGQRFAFDATARSQAPAFDPVAAASAEPGQAKDSGLTTFRGWVEAPIAVSGGEYRICSTQGSCGSFTTANGTVRDGDQVQLRVVAGTFGETRTATVNVGSITASFSTTTRPKDVTPDAVSTFAPLRDQTPAALVMSEVKQLTGHDGVTVSATNGTVRYCGSADCNTKAGSWGATADVPTDGYVQIRTTAPAAGKTISVSLEYGGVAPSTWSVTSTEGPSYVGSYALARLTGITGSNKQVTSTKELAFVQMPAGTTLSNDAQYSAFCASKGFDANLNGHKNFSSGGPDVYSSTNYYSNIDCSYLGSGSMAVSAMTGFKNYGLPIGKATKVVDRGCGNYFNTFGKGVVTTDTLTVNSQTTYAYNPGSSNAGIEKTVSFGETTVVVCQAK